MTRDEAVEIIHGVTYPQTSCGDVGDYSFDRDRKWSERIVDGLVALGILKLDEPKSAEDRLIEAMQGVGFYKSVGEQVVGVIRQSGLKIVEK